MMQKWQNAWKLLCVCEKAAAYLGYVGETEGTHVFGTYKQVLEDQDTILLSDSETELHYPISI